VEQQLDLLEVHQQEIHSGLMSIESEAERMLSEARPMSYAMPHTQHDGSHMTGGSGEC
jgi:hypothetical protein